MKHKTIYIQHEGRTLSVTVPYIEGMSEGLLYRNAKNSLNANLQPKK